MRCGLTARYSSLATPAKATPDLTVDETPYIQRSRQDQHRLLDSEIGQLVTEYLSGSTINQLPIMWSIHRTTVMDHLKRSGTKTRPGGRKLTDKQVADAASRYQTGHSLAALGRHYNVHPETIRRELHKAGITIRPQSRHR